MEDPILIMDFENMPGLPRNFRTTRGKPQQETGTSALWLGWDRLNASAGSQFSELSLLTSLGHMSGQVYIVDLRQESHGFVNGIPVCWYGFKNQANVGKDVRQIAELEQGLVSALASQRTVELNNIVRKNAGRVEEAAAREIDVERCETERQLVERLGLNYVRLPVTDHQHPVGPTVDDFVDFLDGLTGDAWVHFHCRSGKGRSSTFMVLYDIFHNAGQVSLPDIIRRHAIAGSKDVSKTPDVRAKLWKNEMAIKRHEFVADFYSYVLDPDGYGRSGWDDWLSKRGYSSTNDGSRAHQ